MIITQTEPFGAVVTDVDLAAGVGPSEVEALRDALAADGVLVFPDQHALDDDGFTAFLRAFGPLAFTDGEAPLPGHPDLNEVSNVGRTTPPRSNFHIDTGYWAAPPAYTALRAVTVPAEGGATLFSDQRRAAGTLPQALHERIEGRSMTHVATGVELGPDDEAAAAHPLLRLHPRSGVPVLYLDAPARCAAIDGVDPDEVAGLVAELLAHSTTPGGLLAHRWAPGDVVMWDNARVLHKADHAGVVGDRVLHRGMVAAAGHLGPRPVPA